MVESVAMSDVVSLLLGSSVGALIPFGAAGTAALVEAGVKRPSGGTLYLAQQIAYPQHRRYLPQVWLD